MMSLLFAPCIVVCDPLKQFSKGHICRFGVGLDGEGRLPQFSRVGCETAIPTLTVEPPHATRSEKGFDGMKAETVLGNQSARMGQKSIRAAIGCQRISAY